MNINYVTQHHQARELKNNANRIRKKKKHNPIITQKKERNAKKNKKKEIRK